MKCDVLIVGAGLAGATCGFVLASAGISVLAVDCADLATKDKLCGGMLTERSIRILDTIYGPQARGLYRQHFTQMLAADTRVTRGNSIVTLEANMSIVRRKDLDAYAVARFLDAGGMAADLSRLEALDPVERVATVRTPQGLMPVEYTALVVADGATSHTRKTLATFDENLSPKPRVPQIPTLEALADPTMNTVIGWNCPQIHGYCWYFPCGDTANIGVGGTKATKQQLTEALAEFVAMIGVQGVRDLRGAFLPSGGSPLLASRDAFFVGDAAGLACPATGEGIYYALKSGQTLAKSLVNGVSYKSAMSHEVNNLLAQYALSKVVLNETLTVMGIRTVEALGIDTAEIPRAALRLAANFG